MKDVGTQTNGHDQLFLQQYGNDEVVTFNDDYDGFEDDMTFLKIVDMG